MPKRPKSEEPLVSKSLLPLQDPPPPRKRSKKVEPTKEEDAVVDVDPDSEPATEDVAGPESKSKAGNKEIPAEKSKSGPDEGSDTSDPEAAFSDLGSFDDDESDTPSCSGVSRDPDYYFKDGNVIVRVDDVLFKIHTSAFEARSTVFKDIFDVGAGDVESVEGGSDEGEEDEEDGEGGEGKEADGEEADGEETSGEEADGDEEPESDEETEPDTGIEGTRDSIPIPISGVDPSEFRNLLKIFYSLPYEIAFMNLGKDAEGQDLWDNFELLLDVSRLSRKFCIPDMEKWATVQLETLARTKTVELANILRGSATSCDYVVGAIRHAKTVSAPCLAHNVRYMIMVSCRSPPNIVLSPRVLEFFRLEDLFEFDKALYGYAFILLLWLGNKYWGGAEYTHMDRMALFSAQSYLSPLPATLFDGLKSPLFALPDSAPSFSKTLSCTVTPQSCIDKCHPKVFRAWKEEFDSTYYNGLIGTVFTGAMGALQSLVERRMKFSTKIGTLPCPHSCHKSILLQLDQDIEQLFSRLADYYKAIA